MKTFLVVLAAAAAGAGWIYSGFYNVGADRPHWLPTFMLIETTRDRSIIEHAKDVQVPKLNDPKLVSQGAKHYAAMCSGCHLGPGIQDSELRQGLYPKPPKLTAPRLKKPSEQFWAIKHGIKLTAMPAWGTTHDDKSIWSIVAFLQQLPELSADRYRKLTAGGSESHHHGDDD